VAPLLGPPAPRLGTVFSMAALVWRHDNRQHGLGGSFEAKTVQIVEECAAAAALQDVPGGVDVDRRIVFILEQCCDKDGWMRATFLVFYLIVEFQVKYILN
jgi:hypothetical protein